MKSIVIGILWYIENISYRILVVMLVFFLDYFLALFGLIVSAFFILFAYDAWQTDKRNISMGMIILFLCLFPFSLYYFAEAVRHSREILEHSRVQKE